MSTTSWLIEIDRIAADGSAILGENLVMFYLIQLVSIFLNASSVIASVLVGLHVFGHNVVPKAIIPPARGQAAGGLMDHDISTRISFYLSLANLAFSSWHLIDHVMLFVNPRVPSQSLAFSLAFIEGTAFIYQQLISFAPVVVPLNGYGYTGYFCLWNIKTLGGAVVLMFGVALSLANAMATIVGLAQVRRAIASAASTIGKPAQFEATRLQVASRCLVGMIRAASFLHLPRALTLVVIAGFHLNGYIEPVSVLASALFANSAGLVDAYVYIQNQRLKAQVAANRPDVNKRSKFKLLHPANSGIAALLYAECFVRELLVKAGSAEATAAIKDSFWLSYAQQEFHVFRSESFHPRCFSFVLSCARPR
ncbi:hypothetical protein H9P43_005179 [Blastocladiella emersonii ATCC 22665]|nr:hypothetical protein H9P43_005179 [Blastocladiella emersonii ATCC 22665]